MNTFYEHRSCSPSLTAKNFTCATAGCRQQSSLVGTSRGSGGCRASAWLPKWGAFSTRQCVTTRPSNGMASLLGDNALRWEQSSSLCDDPQKFGCGRMHRRAAAGHSQKSGIFVHFALWHGLRGALRGLRGGPGGKPPLEVAGEVQNVLYRNRCGVRLGAHNPPDSEEAHNLFWA